MARARNGAGQRPPRLKPGVKREQIIEVATEYFGHYGLRGHEVGRRRGGGRDRLDRPLPLLRVEAALPLRDHGRGGHRTSASGSSGSRAEHDDWTEALVAVLVDSFNLTEQQILRHRVMVAEFGRVGVQRSLPREEAARSRARALTRELEFAWGTFLARGMQQGLLPESDPRLLTRAVLGLYNSVWHWFRPAGR